MAKTRPHVTRLQSDVRKTFKTAHGKQVLMWLYHTLFGKQTTFPENIDSHRMAFNEGMRMVWLLIMEQLREDDIEMRGAYEEWIAEHRLEAVSERTSNTGS